MKPIEKLPKLPLNWFASTDTINQLVEAVNELRQGNVDNSTKREQTYTASSEGKEHGEGWHPYSCQGCNPSRQDKVDALVKQYARDAWVDSSKKVWLQDTLRRFATELLELEQE